MRERKNPFQSALCRDSVESASFIGRERILQRIADAVISPQGQKGSLAIIGLPDIGKRCLIEQAIYMHKEAMSRQRMIFIDVDIATYAEPDEHDKFFRDLVSLITYEFEEAKFSADRDFDLERLSARVLHDWDAGARSFSTLQNFFRKISNAGFQIICILDNFDHAESPFRTHTQRLQWLRQLAGSNYRVSWIALSCKPIREIKRLPKAISDDFARELYLGMYTDEDIEVYFDVLAQQGFILSEMQKAMITAYCGRHPYLLSLLGYHLLEDYTSQPEQVDLVTLFAKVEERFTQSYERIVDLVLVNGGNDEKLQRVGQILSGNMADVESKVVEQMQAYGLIVPNPAFSPALAETEPEYLGFSEHFRSYVLNRLVKHLSSSALSEQDMVTWNQTMYPGETIAGRYTVTEHLGSTTHNQIVKARDEQLGRYVVLKHPHLITRYEERHLRQHVDLLRREASIQALLQHKYIATVYDVLDDPPAIVMEWIEGHTLDDYWRRVLSPAEVVALGHKLAEALQYLHMHEVSRIIHRDIKPQNVMIRPNGDPALIDFSVARAADRVSTIHAYDEQGHSALSACTPGYAAPEQLSDPRNVTDRADIYALGLVLYQALTAGARLPEQRQPGQSPDQRIPVAFWDILCVLLAADPHMRPDAERLCCMLEKYSQSL